MLRINQSIITKAINAFATTEKKISKIVNDARAEQNKAIDLVLDSMRAACNVPKEQFMKGNAATNPAKKQVAEMFNAIYEAGFIGKKSAEQYASCFWYAFGAGTSFNRDALNKKAAEKKAANESNDSTPKAGKIESTDRKALDATLSKAIKQARLLGLTEFAADIVDLCLEALDDFKESE